MAASSCFVNLSKKALFSGLKQSQIQTRNAVKSAARRRLPTKDKVNPFIKQRTNFIKELCVALVKFDRIQTTLHKALQLKTYGELLIMMTRRRCPPPDLHFLEDGFILTEKEVKNKLTTRRVINRRNKRVLKKPTVFDEEEYVEQLKVQASNILLHDERALERLYGELSVRYQNIYGGFVNITPIPFPPKRRYPRMAYAEFINNDLPPLPKLPDVIDGNFVTYPNLQTIDEMKDSGI